MLPHPRRISGRWILVPFGDTVSQTNVLSFARINVVSARIGGGGVRVGGQLTPRPVRLCRQSQLYFEGGDVCVNVCYENVFALQLHVEDVHVRIDMSGSRARRASHRGSNNSSA